jgi:hypothetical protein
MTVLIKAIGEGGTKMTLNMDNVLGLSDEGQDQIKVTWTTGQRDVIRGDYELLIDRLSMKLRSIDIHEYYKAAEAPNPWAKPEGPAF